MAFKSIKLTGSLRASEPGEGEALRVRGDRDILPLASLSLLILLSGWMGVRRTGVTGRLHRVSQWLGLTISSIFGTVVRFTLIVLTYMVECVTLTSLIYSYVHRNTS